MARTFTLTSDLTGKAIPTGKVARLSLTIGDEVFAADVSTDEPIVRELRTKGSKQNKRGRKAKGNGNSSSNVGSTSTGAVAGKINR